ncbi:MAG: tyrosine-type recombinase/integrase [Dehalococcoidia bacterium]
MLTKFLDDRRARGLSPRTCRFYDGYLKSLLRGITQPVFSMTKDDITDFLNSLTCNPGGKHAYFRAIRTFFRWALDEEYISVLPKMKAPKVPKPLRYAVKLEDIATLLESAKSVRDKLIISMLADTGLRRSELLGIGLDDIDLERQVIKVWGKAKERVVRYGPYTQGLLLDWLKEYQGEGSLFELTGIGLTCVLKRLEKKTGIKCNAHAFRRTFATQSVRNGLNVFYVQSLLGHSSLTMTRIYAEQVSSEDAIKAYKPIVT